MASAMPVNANLRVKSKFPKVLNYVLLVHQIPTDPINGKLQRPVAQWLSESLEVLSIHPTVISAEEILINHAKKQEHILVPAEANHASSTEDDDIASDSERPKAIANPLERAKEELKSYSKPVKLKRIAPKQHRNYERGGIPAWTDNYSIVKRKESQRNVKLDRHLTNSQLEDVHLILAQLKTILQQLDSISSFYSSGSSGGGSAAGPYKAWVVILESSVRYHPDTLQLTELGKRYNFKPYYFSSAVSKSTCEKKIARLMKSILENRNELNQSAGPKQKHRKLKTKTDNNEEDYDKDELDLSFLDPNLHEFGNKRIKTIYHYHNRIREDFEDGDQNTPKDSKNNFQQQKEQKNRALIWESSSSSCMDSDMVKFYSEGHFHNRGNEQHEEIVNTKTYTKCSFQPNEPQYQQEPEIQDTNKILEQIPEATCDPPPSIKIHSENNISHRKKYNSVIGKQNVLQKQSQSEGNYFSQQVNSTDLMVLKLLDEEISRYDLENANTERKQSEPTKIIEGSPQEVLGDSASIKQKESFEKAEREKSKSSIRLQNFEEKAEKVKAKRTSKIRKLNSTTVVVDDDESEYDENGLYKCPPGKTLPQVIEIRKWEDRKRFHSKRDIRYRKKVHDGALVDSEIEEEDGDDLFTGWVGYSKNLPTQNRTVFSRIFNSSRNFFRTIGHSMSIYCFSPVTKLFNRKGKSSSKIYPEKAVSQPLLLSPQQNEKKGQVKFEDSTVVIVEEEIC